MQSNPSPKASAQHTPRPWHICGASINGRIIFMVYRDIPNTTRSEWLKSPQGRDRWFRTEAAARAAIDKATQGAK